MEKFSHIISSKLKENNTWLRRVTFSLLFLLVVVLGVILGIVILGVKGGVGIVVVGGVIVAGALGIRNAGGVLGVVIIVILVVIMVGEVIKGVGKGLEAGAIYLFYLILIPAINSIPDLLSVAVSSKYFADILDNKHNLKKNVSLAMQDLAIAIFLLLLMIAILIFAGIALEQFFIILLKKEKYLNVLNIILHVKQTPWNKDNLWVIFMLLTSLVPTTLHFLVALAGIAINNLFSFPRLKSFVINNLKISTSAEPPQEVIKQQRKSVSSVQYYLTALCISSWAVFLLVSISVLSYSLPYLWNHFFSHSYITELFCNYALWVYDLVWYK
ncbi:MAG: hypothetical protein AAF518_08725 [Spirochaetota bacterium]